MMFNRKGSAFALVLFLVLSGDALASMMVRRAAPDTTLTAGGSSPSDAGVDTSPMEYPSSPADQEVAGKTETEEEEGTDTEGTGGTTVEGANDGNEDQFPDFGFETGLVFGSPFVTVQQMQQYFYELERALHKVFETTLNEAAQNPDMVNNSTTEEITVGGHKYLVNRTVSQGEDHGSQMVIKTITMVPVEERRKRALNALK